jgi:hypothetical protein
MANNVATLDHLNDFIAQSQQYMACGPDCQKQRTANQLKDLYIKAQTNATNGPADMDDAARQYHTFVGDYDTYADATFMSRADKKAADMTAAFNKERADIGYNNDTYNALYIQTTHTDALLASNMREKDELDGHVGAETDRAHVNDRTVFYTSQRINSILWWCFYYLVGYTVLLLLLIYQLYYSVRIGFGAKIGLILAFIAFPIGVLRFTRF